MKGSMMYSMKQQRFSNLSQEHKMTKYELMHELSTRVLNGQNAVGVYQEMINRPLVAGICRGPFTVCGMDVVLLGFQEADESSIEQAFGCKIVPPVKKEV